MLYRRCSYSISQPSPPSYSRPFLPIPCPSSSLFRFFFFLFTFFCSFTPSLPTSPSTTRRCHLSVRLSQAVLGKSSLFTSWYPSPAYLTPPFYLHYPPPTSYLTLSKVYLVSPFFLFSYNPLPVSSSSVLDSLLIPISFLSSFLIFIICLCRHVVDPFIIASWLDIVDIDVDKSFDSFCHHCCHHVQLADVTPYLSPFNPTNSTSLTHRTTIKPPPNRLRLLIIVTFFRLHFTPPPLFPSTSPSSLFITLIPSVHSTSVLFLFPKFYLTYFFNTSIYTGPFSFSLPPLLMRSTNLSFLLLPSPFTSFPTAMGTVNRTHMFTVAGVFEVSSVVRPFLSSLPFLSSYPWLFFYQFLPSFLGTFLLRQEVHLSVFQRHHHLQWGRPRTTFCLWDQHARLWRSSSRSQARWDEGDQRAPHRH